VTWNGKNGRIEDDKPSPQPMPVEKPPQGGDGLVINPSPADPIHVPGVTRFYDKNGMFLINRTGLEMLKHFESGPESRWEHYLTAYIDPVGVPTIGFGHIKTVTHADVAKKKKITMAEAERLLMEDLYEEGAKYVRAFMKHEDRLNDNQFSCLTDLTFNRGSGRFNDQMDDIVDGALEDSVITSDEFGKIATRLLYYNFAISKGQKKILEGLSRRRAANHLLFLSKDWAVTKDIKNWQRNYKAELAR